MEKLRRPWRRSRTPAPSDRLRPVCSSLDSVDKSSLVADAEGTQRSRLHRGSSDTDKSHLFLRIPSARTRRRSRSFDFFQVSSEAHLTPHDKEYRTTPTPILNMLRRSFSRNSSSSDRGSVFCVHCLCVEEYERRCCPASDPATPAVEELFLAESDSSESDCEPNDTCSSGSVDQHTTQSSHLSFLGGSIECHQKVEPWIRTNELVPDMRSVIRRGRSLGLATDVTIVEPSLRRGGSEYKPDMPSQELEEPKWQKDRCKISFNISLSCSEPSAQCSTESATSPIASGRRSPGGAGTPRLERQEALSGWLESEPSLDLLAPSAASVFDSRQVSVETHTSMETHASASLEVDSGASVQQRASIESQSSFSIDVPLQESTHRTSLDSQTSVDSMASSVERFTASSPGSSIHHHRPLLAQRRCLSAGASPCTSPPIYLSNSRFGLASGAPSPRLNLAMGSSSEYGEAEVEITQLSPSPPAEIYLAVPILAPVLAATQATAGPMKVIQGKQVQPPRLSRNDSTRSSSDKDPRLKHGGTKLNSSADCINLHPAFALRSQSIEVGLPTAHHSEYHKLAGSARRQQWVSRVKKSSPGELVIQSENGERRVLRSTPDWSEDAINGDHLWIPTSVSGDLCYLGDQECTKTGPRMKCSACRIVAHISCIPHLNFACRLTFWDGDLRQYRGNTETLHHLVHRRSETGKCQRCSKSFQSKLSFSMKEIVAISCSWCKAAFHNKDTCFNVDRLKETCSLGGTANVTVPPSWIVKLPARETFKSSLRKSPRKKDKGSTRRKKEKAEKESKAFIIKAIPSAKIKPILVFINPKSGGNQGAKLMQKFQWLLNPRQVFDLTQGGPRFGLEMFRKVPNVRVLACGGDGTAGWVLSILDQIAFNPAPPVGVLPLGTGNDLARAFGWGGGYADEPISKILFNMYEAEPVMLDRWELQVEKNAEAPPTDDASHPQGKDNLPLNVVNNYFSFGVDAQIALDFHEAREARPQKFNSRLRNKMFYGQAGGKDLLQRKWKDLSEFVTIECDGKDITAKLREHKVHAVLFLNIPSYGGGTHPWNRAAGQDQVTDDRMIEVVGLTTYQLPLLQAGGHGTCLTQCRTARVVTRRTIPMQVDGEACRLNPSIITLRHLNQVPILAKRRPGSTSHSAPVVEQIKVQVRQISMSHYEQHHYDKEALQSASTLLGAITIRQDAVLGQIRKTINELLEQWRTSRTGAASATNGDEGTDKIQIDWCFIDSCTAERFFRVDTGQEHLHYITDITTDDLYILEQDSFSSDTQSTVELPDTHLEDLEPPCEVGENRSNGRALSEDAGVDDMMDLANSQLDQCDGRQTIPAADSQRRNPPPADPESPSRADQESAGRDPAPQFAAVTAESPLLEQASDLILRAAKAGDIKKLRDLHSKGYSLLSIDSAGQTALHWAARHGHSNVIKYLLAQAPPSLRDMVDSERGQSALHKAAQAKQHTACTMLVASGANLFLADREGLTPLQLARRAADDDLVAYLQSQELFQRNHPEDVETQV